MQLSAFRLEADRALGELTLSGRDLNAVDLAGDLAVFADDLRGVPVADFDGLLLSFGVFLEGVLDLTNREDVAVVALQALHFDALGPNPVFALDVNQTAAVTVFDVFPVETENVVFVAFVSVEITVGLSGNHDDPVLDRERLIVVRFAVLKDSFPTAEVFAVEEIDEIFFAGVNGGGDRRDNANKNQHRNKAG